MNYTWFKLYHDMPDDIKLRRFSPEEKWAWVALLCLASKSHQRGVVIAENDDIADYCEFNSTQDWLYFRDKLIAKGMLEINADGNVSILHWEDRQYEKPSDRPEAIRARVAKHRAKQKERVKLEDETPCNALHVTCNADVTPQIRSEEIKTKTKNLDPDQVLNTYILVNSEAESTTEAPSSGGSESVPVPPKGDRSSAQQIKLEWLKTVFIPNYPYRLQEGGGRVRNIGAIANNPGAFTKYLTVEAIESGKATQALREMIAVQREEWRSHFGTEPEKITPRGSSQWVYVLRFIPDPSKWLKERRWGNELTKGTNIPRPVTPENKPILPVFVAEPESEQAIAPDQLAAIHARNKKLFEELNHAV